MARILYYTFGNHMHWVDMQWLWGYGVLPGSVDDMLRLVREAGVRGNVNFDAVGYEKMAAECPAHLDALRAAIARGEFEPVGCSYGQPYGLFHGGESNVRQLTFGVRATRRHLGVRPRTFWEEEFYFFPQLPQLLAQCGYTGACLFFQWTWHTPELPHEDASLIHWEGADGTRLPTLPRNGLNVHQWPEDFEGLLDGPLIQRRDPAQPTPAIVQWLELMPTRDWMCRSEVLLPRLRELMSDARFEIRASTAGQLIDALRAERALAQAPAASQTSAAGSDALPVRAYAMSDVWHGMTLGKNADRHPRTSRRVEQAILHAESLAALSGVLGRPYPSWDVYPTWELDESWRELLAAQHHDNHECEGLCGFVGHHQMEKAGLTAQEVFSRAAWLCTARAGTPLLFNGLGWMRPLASIDPHGPRRQALVPAFGFARPRNTRSRPARAVRVSTRRKDATLTVHAGDIAFAVDRRSGAVCSLSAGRVAFGADRRVLDFVVGGKPALARVELADRVRGEIVVEYPREKARLRLTPNAEAGALDVVFELPPDPPRKPGYGGAMAARIRTGFSEQIHVLTPFGAETLRPDLPARRRKYPSGDWMTSPQWFEQLDGAFSSDGCVDFVDAGAGCGLLVCHEGPMQWSRANGSLHAILTAHDPWDEDRYDVGPCGTRALRLVPHDGLAPVERARLSAAFSADLHPPAAAHAARPVGGGTAAGVTRDIPEVFGPLEISGAPGVLAHAFHRESMKAGENLDAWAGHRMFRESGGACDHPFVLRLVEWNGAPTTVTLKLAGPVALCAKTTVLGEVLQQRPGRVVDTSPTDARGWSASDTGWLDVSHPVPPPAWARGASLSGQPLTWSSVSFSMRPCEIATIYADLELGRKQWRDLDAKRSVWATIHKTPQAKARRPRRSS